MLCSNLCNALQIKLLQLHNNCIPLCSTVQLCSKKYAVNILICAVKSMFYAVIATCCAVFGNFCAVNFLCLSFYYSVGYLIL